jgi:hypothetical protein
MLFTETAKRVQTGPGFAFGVDKPAVRKEMEFGIRIMNPMNRLDARLA